MDYHIFKKPKNVNGKKSFDWYYWYWDDSHSKQIQKRCKGCFSKRAAADYVAQLPPIIRCRARVCDYADTIFCNGSEYLERCRQFGQEFNAATLRAKRGIAQKIKAAFGRLPFAALTEKFVGDYLLSIDDTPSLKNAFISVLREIFKAAQWDGIVGEIPAFKNFSYHPKKADILSADEIRKLFDRSIWSDEKTRMSYLVALAAGLRSGEAFAIQKNQFFFDKGAILVNGFLKHEGNTKTEYNKTGDMENKRWRISMIDPAFFAEIKSFVEGGGFADDDFLFGKDGAPPKYVTLKDRFAKALKLSGIDTDGRRISPHSLRYTYITRMRTIFDADFVRKLAGHSSVEMTDYYTRNELNDNMDTVSLAQKKLAEFYSAK